MPKQSSSYRALCLALLVIAAITFQVVPHSGAVYAKLKRDGEKKTRSEARQTTTATNARPQRTPVPDGVSVSIVATKQDAFPDHGDGMAHEGDTITYTVRITNNGVTDATGVVFNDVIDSNTSTLVPGSPMISPVAFSDTYSALGNVRINTANIVGPGHSVLDNDALTNGGVLSGFGNSQANANGTVPNGTNSITTTNGGTVVMNSDGTFTFNPAPGFNGLDSFFYAVTSPTTSTGTAQVTINVSSAIWFINNSGANGDGRLTAPFNSIANYNASAPTKDPNDTIFIYTGTGTYTGNLTLVNGMKLIGQGVDLATAAGLTVPPGSDPLPTAVSNPDIDSSAGDTVTLAQNNTIRGLNLRNSAGIDLAGTNFGTLTVSGVGLTGTGRPLSLNNGTLAVTLNSITSTSSSGGQGISLSSVGGAMSVIGGTSITNPTTQGILVTGSTANIDFGNTVATGGTNGISLQNNSAGTRTFGTLSIANSSSTGFLHAVGGGLVTAGTTTITDPAGTAIDIQNSTTLITFGDTTINKGASAGIGVNMANCSGNLTFNSLAITTSNGSGLVGTENTGTITVTNNTGSVSAIGGPALNITKSAGSSPVSLSFANVSSNSSATQGINLSNVSGTITAAGGTVTGSSGTAVSVNGGSVTLTYPGNVTQNNAQRVVDVQNTVSGSITLGGTVTGGVSSTGVNLNNDNGNVSFSTLNLGTSGSRMTSQAITITGGTGTFSLGTVSVFTNNVSGVVAMNADGTLNSTSGTVNATNARAVNIDGPAGLTTLGVTLISVASTNSSTAGISLQDTNGSFTVIGDGSNNGSGGTIQNAATNGITLTNVMNISLTSMSIQSTAHYGVSGTVVTNFSFINGTINNSGTGLTAQDSNIGFNLPASGATNVSGTLTVTGSTLTNSFYHGITVRQDNGTISDLNISNNTFTSSTVAASSNGSAIDIDPAGNGSTAASVTKGTIDGNVITNFPSGAGIQMLGGNTNSISAPFSFMGTPGDATNKISITNNQISGQSLANGLGTNAIAVQLNGRGQSNFEILTNGTVANPLKFFKGNGILYGCTGRSTCTGKINNNLMDGSANLVASPGISVGTDNTFATTDTPNFSLEIIGNTIVQTDGNGILATARSATGTAGYSIKNNIVGAPRSGVRPGIRVDAGNATSIDDAVCLDISGNTSAGSGGSQGIGLRKQGTNPTVNDFGVEGMAATSSPGVEAFVNGQNPAGGGTLLISATSGFSNCSSAPIAPPGSESANTLNTSRRTRSTEFNSLQLQNEALTISSSTDNSFAPIVKDKTSRPETPERLSEIAALPSTERPEKIRLNHSAKRSGGLGTANEDRMPEFPGSLIMGRMAAIPGAKPIAPLSGGTVNLNIGTLTAGSSVTITFQVTVNSAAPAGTTNISNQGTVSGTNFSSVPTDDPDTAQPNDPTLTPLLHPTAADGIVTGRILTEAGTPVEGTVVRLSGAQTRKTITDAEGNYHFDNVQTGGFYTVTPSRVNYNFNPFNRSFNQLGNSTEAAFTALFTADTANPLDTAEYFVRQQYVDILGREPDEGGFNYWSDRIIECGTDLLCVNTRRREVAAAFFIEQEFQQTGSFIYDLYKGGLGRLPIFTEYAADHKRIVGGATLDSDKAAFAQAFVQRSEFLQMYQSNTTGEAFVDALIANVQQVSGVDLSSQRDSLLIRYNSGASQIESRGFVLRDVADSNALKQAEYNGAFVLTEYFGYLLRDPDTGGYAFWLDVLNNREAGNYRGMVCAFITSEEYQRRFSTIVTRTNANCGQ